ncbi:alpha/beta hydrolase [Massilia sp. R2A-15]|uniref:alpha/beta hydrolase n=1 Tax=Massilia sp. R2A-15 TaxID=3064278 RepID=UPI00273309BE|nr:alpha/beta hydrolase [Massilia sp. R2A-15]WLI87654.1 alpha/beta hydrolase [Massilia sp. R2A-15]
MATRIGLTLAAAAFALACLAACSPLTALNALSPANGVHASTGLAFGANPRLKLDIYRPATVTAASPVVVFFYGGNWTSGQRESYAFVGRALAARGFVVVIPDYRLYPEVSYPDFLDDAAQAVAWTAKHIAGYGGDPNQLFVMGHSAGAYNAAMIALDGRWLAKQGMTPAALRGWIGMAGPYDFLPVENPTARPVFHFPDTPAESQPVNHLDGPRVPALLIAASSDRLVNPARNTGGLAKRLRARGVSVEEIYYDGVNHATLVASLATPLRKLAPTLDAVDKFVRKHTTLIQVQAM